jgi:hypothetical protein
VPDRVNAEPLGCHDFPFKIVAEHPGLVRPDAEHFHRMIVGPLLGLAEAVLALDLDVVETVFEGETHDLGTLRLGPVGPRTGYGLIDARISFSLRIRGENGYRSPSMMRSSSPNKTAVCSSDRLTVMPRRWVR